MDIPFEIENGLGELMDIPLEIENILDKYEIEAVDPKFPIFVHYGLGDLLFMIILQRQNKIDRLNFNLVYFDADLCGYFDEPLNALEFRMQLLKDFNVDVGYMYLDNIKDNKTNINDLIKSIDNYNINNIATFESLNYINTPYIIFHTKLRLDADATENIDLVKEYVTEVLTGFVSKYKIVILGERDFTCKDIYVNKCITTIYEELMILSEKNDILDLTDDSIHNNLDYERLKYAIGIIQGAECNFTFGWGGSFCLSLIFGKKCITYIDQIDYSNILDIDHLNRNNTYLHRDINKFKENLFRGYSVRNNE